MDDGTTLAVILTVVVGGLLLTALYKPKKPARRIGDMPDRRKSK